MGWLPPGCATANFPLNSTRYYQREQFPKSGTRKGSRLWAARPDELSMHCGHLVYLREAFRWSPIFRFGLGLFLGLSFSVLPGKLDAARVSVPISGWSTRGTITIKYRGAGKATLPAATDVFFGPLEPDTIDVFFGPQKAAAVGSLNISNYALLLEASGRDAQIRGPFATSRGGKPKLLASPLAASLQELPSELKAIMIASIEEVAGLNPATTVIEVQDIKVKAKPKPNDTIKNKVKIRVTLTGQAQGEMKTVKALLSYKGEGERVF